MENQRNLVLQSLLNQREGLFHLNGLSRCDLEVLAFALDFSLRKKGFFSVYDAQKYYHHTNPGHIRRCVSNLLDGSYIQKFSSGTKNHPALYVITPSGKKALEKYSSIVLNENPSPNP